MTVLNLTVDQKAKVQPILDQAKPQLQAIREDAMAKAKAVFQNTDSQLKSILTPDQQKKLDEIQQRANAAASPTPRSQAAPSPAPSAAEQPAKT